MKLRYLVFLTFFLIVSIGLLMVPVIRYGQEAMQEQERRLMRNTRQLERKCAAKWPKKMERYEACLAGMDTYGGQMMRKDI